MQKSSRLQFTMIASQCEAWPRVRIISRNASPVKVALFGRNPRLTNEMQLCTTHSGHILLNRIAYAVRQFVLRREVCLNLRTVAERAASALDLKHGHYMTAAGDLQLAQVAVPRCSKANREFQTLRSFLHISVVFFPDTGRIWRFYGYRWAGTSDVALVGVCCLRV